MQEIVLLCMALILSVGFLVLIAQKLKIAYPVFFSAGRAGDRAGIGYSGSTY